METTGHSSRDGGRSPEPRGLTAELLSLFGSFTRHLTALGALAGEEAREAGALYLRLAVMLGAALFFAAFGYILLWIFVAFLIAAVCGISWVWIVLVSTVLHLGIAFVCANHVRTHWRTPVFPATAAEIRRDIDSLKK